MREFSCRIGQARKTVVSHCDFADAISQRRFAPAKNSALRRGRRPFNHDKQ